MKREDRRAAAAAYKERKVPAGIYALRCSASGQCWVGKATDFGAARNRLWFMLGRGAHLNPNLQAAWRLHGPEGFTFEPIETLDDDLTVYVRNRTLKERLAFWQSELDAETVP